jgi:hypothetical protein
MKSAVWAAFSLALQCSVESNMSRPKEPPVEHTPPTPEELSAAPTRDAGATPASGDAGSLIELPSVLTLPKNPPPAGESPDD